MYKDKNKKVPLLILAFIVGGFVGYAMHTNQIVSQNLEGSANRSLVSSQARDLQNVSQAEMADVEDLDDGTGNKVPTPNKILLFGGLNNPQYLNDLWQSPGGKTWNLVPTGGTMMSLGTVGNTMLYYKNKLYLLGGITGLNQNVWMFDGASWIQKTTFPGKGSDSGYGSAVYKGKIYVFGGADSNDVPTNEFWSYDGNIWTQLTNAPFAPRRYFLTIVYQNQFWVIGGVDSNSNYLKDVWSYDGNTWSSHGNVPWTNISNGSEQTASIFDDGTGPKIYVMGGVDSYGTPNSNVWAFDGNAWTQKPNGGWSKRGGLRSFTLYGKLFVVGGYSSFTNTYFDDVWSTGDGSTWQLEKPHSAWGPRSTFSVAKVPSTF